MKPCSDAKDAIYQMKDEANDQMEWNSVTVTDTLIQILDTNYSVDKWCCSVLLWYCSEVVCFLKKLYGYKNNNAVIIKLLKES